MFCHNMIPTINRSTRVARNTVTAIDHFITNTVVDTKFKSVIIQTNLSDHFPIIFVLKTNENMVEKNYEHFVYKRYYDKKSTNLFNDTDREKLVLY